MIRVSAGTAQVLGLLHIKCLALPTTAYILIGEKCARDCGFCSRSRSSAAGADFLSRVTWPAFPAAEVVERLRLAYLSGRVARACLQVVHGRAAWNKARRVLEDISQACSIPVSVSCTAGVLEDIGSWFDAGAQRFGLALDAAAGEVFAAVKGGHWRPTLSLLYRAAEKWPGRISTHLIAGLGETDRDMIFRLQDMLQRNVTVGLFAFTPVKGTRLAGLRRPSLARYRRIQAAYHLMKEYRLDAAGFCFDRDGNLANLGLGEEEARALLGDGRAFMTTGCPGCNRPFYNEHPGGDMYNYPRAPGPREIEEALRLVLAGEIPRAAGCARCGGERA